MINELFGFPVLPIVNSKVTMTLGELLDTYTGTEDVKYSDIIWDFDPGWYYTGADQAKFESKVIDHFRFRQIGFETPGRFVFEFQKKFKEIMPYYIQMYHSVELMDDVENPLDNYSMTETLDRETTDSGSGSNSYSGTGTNSGTVDRDVATTGSDTNTTQSLDKHLDTAQGRIQNLTDGYMSYADNHNGTDARTTSGSEDETVTTSINNSETAASTNSNENEGTLHQTLQRSGNIGVTTYAQMLEGLRNSYLNIDMMIIDELDEIFLQIF